MPRATRREISICSLGAISPFTLLLFDLADGGSEGPSVLLLSLVVIAAAAWFFGFFLFYLGYNRVSRVAVTDGEIRHAIGYPWPRYQTVRRSDVRAAVVHEGDGTVVLLGEAGALLRTRHMAGAAAFAEALGAPTVAWPVRVGGDPGLWSIYLALWTAVAIVPAFFLAVYPGALLGAGLLKTYIAGFSGSDIGPLAIILVTMPVVLLTFGLAMAMALFLGVAAGRFLFKLETLHGFIRAMCRTPHWDGFAPPPRPGRRRRPAPCYTAWCARLVGIPPPPEPRPDLRHGATPEMAAAVLAAAEAG
jgi:hypothetical protein